MNTDGHGAGTVIAPAAASDGAAIAALLKAAGLPHEDFAAHLGHFVVARKGGELVGVAGAEVYGSEALLRSLAVAPARRGAGVGGGLVEALERAGDGWGVRRWWLLTTTAEAFFARRGFHVVRREDAPAAIAATREFRELCPSAAVCLTRERRVG